MTTGHYQILYSVRHPDGRLIMEAPIETVVLHYHLHPDAIRRMERETRRLDGIAVLRFLDPEMPATVYVQRLPTVIPSPTPEAPEDDPKTFLRENLP